MLYLFFKLRDSFAFDLGAGPLSLEALKRLLVHPLALQFSGQLVTIKVRQCDARVFLGVAELIHKVGCPLSISKRVGVFVISHTTAYLEDLFYSLSVSLAVLLSFFSLFRLTSSRILFEISYLVITLVQQSFEYK